ncbi:DUF6492 family protein [Agrococcus citreus]|uniref:Uncharacterized protein n=1 Tax=Agrococcus citreus TaxID=84643 RepID=A0ABN1YNE9_9MICO
MSAALTFVTVVFEPELPLLRLQARSLRRFLDPACVAQLIVLDNCARGMGRGARRAVLRELGPTLAPLAAFIRAKHLGVEGATEGWRGQQAAKLLVSRRVRTDHFVVLDAKNHLIAAAGAVDLVDADGVARGGTHPYTTHPLRADLERTLRYLGADDERVQELVADFPRTATPFVMDARLARRMLDDIERTSGRPFAAEFEHARLLEFFLYSGWSILRGEGVPVDGEPIQSPIVWPAHADEQGAADAIEHARATGAAWFAVHRRALARSDRATRRRIIALWVERGLMDRVEAARFVRRFRLAYLPATGRARLARRLSGLADR